MAMTKMEKISHYGIVIMAISAVVVSVWQVRLTQTHNKLSVRPFLDYFHGYTDQDTWQLDLSNEGVGPAILKSIEITYKGETHHNWDKLMQDPVMKKAWITSTNFSPNTPYATNKKVVLLKLNMAEVPRPIDLKIQINYESIYEEPFELTINL